MKTFVFFIFSFSGYGGVGAMKVLSKIEVQAVYMRICMFVWDITQ